MKKGKPKTLIILFIILMFGGYFINHFFSAAILQYQYKMERYGMDSVRTEIWKEYLQGTLSNIGNFFFGVSTKDTVYPKLSYYGGNTVSYTHLDVYKRQVLFAFIYVITDLVQMPTLIGNMLVALVGLCSFFYVFVKRRKTWVVERVTLYAILLTFCMIISILYNNNANITNILWIWGYLGIALVLWICRLSSTALFGIYYSVALIFLI